MKATIEIPDKLYRQVKAKSALEGRAVREVTAELYRSYLRADRLGDNSAAEPAAEFGELPGGAPLPSWFGVLRQHTRRARGQDMESIRASIAAGIAGELDL